MNYVVAITNCQGIQKNSKNFLSFEFQTTKHFLNNESYVASCLESKNGLFGFVLSFGF